MSFCNNTHGWITAYSEPYSYLYHTIDGGTSWSFQGFIPIESPTIQFINQHEGWAAGVYPPRIAYTNDGGENWTIQLDNTNGFLYDIYINPNYKGWAVGDNAMILHTENGGGVIIGTKENNIIADNFGIEIYPNPFSNSLKVRPSRPVLGIVILKLLDSKGTEIFSKEFKSGINQDQEIQVQKFNLSKGTYFYILETEHFKKSGKLIHR